MTDLSEPFIIFITFYADRKHGERMPTSETPHQPRIHLTEARVSYNLSQQEVADDIGTTYVNVSRWERGITRPNPYFRRKLCALFNKTEEELDLLQTRSERASKRAAVAAPNAPVVQVPVVPQTIHDPAIPLLPAIQLIGREGDLALIKQRLKGSGNMALTALNGLPGVGKTALSVALAHDSEMREFFKDGILWAGLGPQPNLPGIFSRWGNLLGISFAEMTKLGSDEARAKAIRTAIGNRTMLIVIDDAWKLEEALAFRVGGNNCAHLVTTRFPNIASHMALGNAINIRELGESESISLLNLLAPQVIYREQQKVHDLVQAVGGLPLALTLIGNYLRKQAYSGPARRITSALERLSSAEVRLKLKEPHIPAESHPSLPNEQSLSIQSIIAVTDQLLDEEARRTLYALSVFPPKPNTFSEEAAMAVAACSTDELDALSDAGMLESNGERYQLHQVISDYALLQISDDQLTSAQERLIAYYADYVEEHKKDYEQLEEESSTIEAALEIAYEVGEVYEFIKGYALLHHFYC
ncbi:helix-turn-helix domain-containing protein [Dictyobacter kobayashii]|nr:helix-turn-helix domain-containing protein [Dictyobacter kobayashii]